MTKRKLHYIKAPLIRDLEIDRPDLVSLLKSIVEDNRETIKKLKDERAEKSKEAKYVSGLSNLIYEYEWMELVSNHGLRLLQDVNAKENSLIGSLSMISNSYDKIKTIRENEVESYKIEQEMLDVLAEGNYGDPWTLGLKGSTDVPDTDNTDK